jgi:hypothetical protein
VVEDLLVELDDVGCGFTENGIEFFFIGFEDLSRLEFGMRVV